MKKFLLAVAIVTAGLMTSCAVSEHLTSNRNVMQTNVELSKNNFQVIGTAQGSATVTRVFGIGGLSLKAIRANAYAEMVKNAKLSGSQALINVNTEVKQRGIAPLYWKTVITTCGQVIEFTSTEEQVSEHHVGTAKRVAPRTAETTMTEEIIVVDPIAKIKSNTICYAAYKDKTISVNIAKHPQLISNEYINGQGIFTFKNKITSIPEKAFFNCSKLDCIILPESVIEIGDSAFASCHYLKMVYCQSTVPPTLGHKAFARIFHSAKIYVPKESVHTYKSTDGWKDYASMIVGCDFK
ncbi:DUF6567 family protein [Alistipes dispar]|uniref:DUF6567 family protein n=1 Tax=Alistipes dispar TaxID=2585119 RepID=UPI00248C529F|nr:DUF6567 family protein [Alistipes dispar]